MRYHLHALTLLYSSLNSKFREFIGSVGSRQHSIDEGTPHTCLLQFVHTSNGGPCRSRIVIGQFMMQMGRGESPMGMQLMRFANQN